MLLLDYVSLFLSVIEISFLLQLYKGGVLDDKAACQDSCSLDHGVLAVGYGLDAQSNKSYYRVKNSWGKVSLAWYKAAEWAGLCNNKLSLQPIRPPTGMGRAGLRAPGPGPQPVRH